MTADGTTTATPAPPRTVDEVAARLAALTASLPPTDGVGVFAGVYLTVTEAIADRLGAGGFQDPAATTELDVVFAARFLDAVATAAAGGRPGACWRPLFELRANPHVHPLQYALAGINAHVEHDLPLSVVDTCRARGTTPDAVQGDYHRINDILASVEDEVQRRLLPADALEQAADPLLHLVGSWSIDRARDAAWASTQALWELRGAPVAYDALAGALDDSVGLVCRCLLTPLP